MGRLIDADILERSLTEIDEHINMDIFTNEVRELIDNAPTVEAIPKDQYEARLKADMVAMLKEIQLEIEEKEYLDGEEPINITQDYIDEVKSWEYGKKDCHKIIQEKIDKLKGVEE